MEVGRILAPGTVTVTQLNQFKLGERLLVEVVHKTAEGEGKVRVKGQDLFALLETTAEVGDKFWVKVGSMNEGSLMLIREQKRGNIQTVPQEFQQLTDRGLPINQNMLTLLKTFSTENTRILDMLLGTMQGTMTDEFMSNLLKSIPEWDELTEKNGAEKLVECLRKLGLNYEQRIQQMLKLEPQAKETEKNSLKSTFKFALLEAIQHQKSQDLYDPDGPLAQLLQQITGQQLWFKTGAQDNAYMLLQLPLLNQGKLVPVQIAIESARKGTKMDEQHCRIAIQLETQLLGVVGIDALFDQDSLTLCVLNRDLPFLSQLLEEVIPETKVELAKLGFKIANIYIGDLDKNREFQNFLRGSRRSGVDIQR